MDAYGFDPNKTEIDSKGKKVARCGLCKERIREDEEGKLVEGELRHVSTDMCISQLHRKIAHLKESNAKYGERQAQRGKHIQKLTHLVSGYKGQVLVLKQLVYRNQKALHDAGLAAIYAHDGATFVAERHSDTPAEPVSLT